MKTKIFVLLILCIPLFFSCQEELFNQDKSSDKNQLLNDTTGCPDIIIDFEQFENAVTDYYSIDTAYLEGDSLVITVNYSGGCGTTGFNLVTHGYYMESYPVQLNVLLDIEHNDPCEALIQKTLCFDLAALANHYNQSYQTSGGIIIIHLEKYTEALIFRF